MAGGRLVNDCLFVGLGAHQSQGAGSEALRWEKHITLVCAVHSGPDIISVSSCFRIPYL